MNKLIILSLSVLLLNSCADEFLAEAPFSTLAPENFYNNANDANAATLGIYHSLYTSEGLYRRFLWAFPESATDLFTGNPTAAANGREFADYIFNSESVNIKTIWTDCYECIKRCNSVIDNLERDVPVSDDLKLQFTGEAKFVRALIYYNLVQLFGDVPLIINEVTSLDNIKIQRTPSSQVWEQVYNDLNFAIGALPEKSDYDGVQKARATKGAARMLLAKAKMVNNNWSEALIQIDDIITSDEYSLEEDPRDIYKVANENGKESIFEAQFISGYTPKLGASFYAYFVPNSVFKGWGTFQSVDAKLAFYDKSSDRFKAFWTDTAVFTMPDGKQYNLGSTTRHYLYKFYDVYRPQGLEQKTFNDYEFNLRIFRYADVLLMKAECENEISGPIDAAISAINEVRFRAGETEFLVSDFSSKDDFRETIFIERYLELCGEGHRYYDLKRRGIDYFISNVSESKGFEIKDYQFFLPIPNVEVILSDGAIIQNPGW